MSSNPKWMLSAIAVAALLSAPLLVMAADAPVGRAARSADVHFADLNLDRAGAAASLYGRLSAAADSVCSSRAFTSLYYTYADYRSCVAEALRRAVAEVHHPALSAYYLQQQLLLLPQAHALHLAKQ